MRFSRKIFLFEALDKLGQSPVGKDILRMTANRSNGGDNTVALSTDLFLKSEPKDGLIDQDRSTCGTASNCMSSPLVIINDASVQRALIDGAQRTAMVNDVVATIGHELVHIHIARKYINVPDELQFVFNYLWANEQHAQLDGWAIEAELAPGKQKRDGFMENPEKYWSDLRESPSYCLLLDKNELSDPVGAYKARLNQLRHKFILKFPGTITKMEEGYAWASDNPEMTFEAIQISESIKRLEKQINLLETELGRTLIAHLSSPKAKYIASDLESELGAKSERTRQLIEANSRIVEADAAPPK